MKKLRHSITYRVPDWNYCNHVKPGTLTKLTKERCTFCIKLDKNRGYTCAIHNMPLTVDGAGHIEKAAACLNACCGIRTDVVHEPEQSSVTVDPKKVIKATIDNYLKTRNDLLSQGYPEVIADRLAKDLLLGDG